MNQSSYLQELADSTVIRRLYHDLRIGKLGQSRRTISADHGQNLPPPNKTP